MVFIPIKRTREEEGELENLTMANYLMLLSQNGQTSFESTQYSPSRVFECKTCNRQFPSFQALGGHRASHKKPKLIGSDYANNNEVPEPSRAVKPKSHECSICGLEFAIGQALGGHMRRHRANNNTNENRQTPATLKVINLFSSNQQRGAVVKKSSSKRVLCLDLNLTPLENDFKVWV